MQEIADEAINNPSFYPSSTEFSINYALSVKNADGKIINYSHSTMQTWYQNVQGNYNFSLTQTNEDTAQQYVDTYREAMTANGETVVAESLHYVIQPQLSFSLMDQHTGYVKVLVGGRGEKSGNRTLNLIRHASRVLPLNHWQLTVRRLIPVRLHLPVLLMTLRTIIQADSLLKTLLPENTAD